MTSDLDVYELIKGTGVQLQPGDEIIYESYEGMVTIMDAASGELLYLETLH